MDMNSKLIISISDKDITGSDKLSAAEPRIAVNAVLFDNDGNIAISFMGKYDLHTLPGGGIEADENLHTALKREILEETGCECEIIEELGHIIENRFEHDFTQKRYYYIARILGEKGSLQLTEEEIEANTTVMWITLEEALKIISEKEHENYQRKFIQKRDIAALIEALKWQCKHYSVSIRLAKPTDALDMAEVGMRSWEVAYKDIIPEDYIREKNATRPEQYKRVITEDNENSYVIQYKGKTVGIMKVDAPQDNDADDTFYELHYIYLHPDYFRMGIGTQAMDFAFEKARNLGKKIMTVWVLEDNVNSVKFYEKCGFVADGKTATQNRGKPLTLIRMRKEL